jgi:hypothetical protein
VRLVVHCHCWLVLRRGDVFRVLHLQPNQTN